MLTVLLFLAEGECKCCADSNGTMNCDGLFMRFKNMFDDGQPKAGAAPFS